MKFLVVLLSFVLFFPIGAFADTYDMNSFVNDTLLKATAYVHAKCDPSKLKSIIASYPDGISGFNQSVEGIVNVEKSSPLYEGLIEKAYNGSSHHIDAINERMSYLENCHVNPDSVASLTSKAYDVLNYVKEAAVYKVPDWIKNNAGWWNDGKIEDSDFVNGIQYLIKKGVIEIPETVNKTTKELSEIPSWLKDVAGYWSQGYVSDREFVTGIQWLIENGIIQVST